MLKCFECSDVILLIVIHYDAKLTCKYVSSGTGFPCRQYRIRRWPKYTLMEPARGHVFLKCPIMHWDIKITWGELVTKLKASTLHQGNKFANVQVEVLKLRTLS